MTLSKPPLVEVWLSFEYEPPTGGGAWTEDRYRVFLKRIEGTHPNPEELIQSGLRRKGAKHAQLVEAVVAVRSFSESGTRAIQLRPNQMVVNYVRTEAEPYPGFVALLDEALVRNRDYRECYNPAGVVAAALHYVDVIEIPVPESGTVQSEEYFTINLRLPDTFVSVVDFHLATVLRVAETNDVVELVFSSEPFVKGEAVRKFRLEWHASVMGTNRMDEDELRSGLTIAHDRLYGCFRSVFTAKGWNLFEPQTS